MSEIKKLPERNQVPLEQTWDLTKIFKNNQAFDENYQSLLDKLKNVEKYQGSLEQGSDAFLEAIEYVLSIYKEVETIYVYAHLKNDQDTTDTVYQALYARASTLLSKASESVSWFEPEILSLDDKLIWSYFSENKQLEEYRHFIENILNDRPHILSADKEALLAGAGEIFNASSNTFSILNNADLEFPIVQNEQGDSIQLTHGVYGQLMESTNRKVRQEAFEGLYTAYKQFRNTFAQTLGSHIKVHNYKATIRNYSSAREAALSNNHIPESVYDHLLDVVHHHLPLLHRYIGLRKKLLEVSDLHMYDLYTPILGETSIKYSYDQAQEKVLAALEPLGEEYLSVVKQAFDNRWIDVVENQGKRSGAYSSGAYDTVPYILMNWHDSLDQLYTLVHEMGHSIHSHFTRNNQPYVYGDYSIFLAEIASTTNENVLTEYLLTTEKDPRVRAYILNHYLDGFKGTVFRQTQFAEFEHFIHTKDAEGVPLTSEYLSEAYGELNAKYYGNEVVKDSEIALEWTRIPHFYYNYYVYQYATGFSAASALSNKILSKEPQALENYLNYLKAGSSDYPIEVMKKAGVDMTQKQYLEDAMKVFEMRLNELEQLIDQL